MLKKIKDFFVKPIDEKRGRKKLSIRRKGMNVFVYENTYKRFKNFSYTAIRSECNTFDDMINLLRNYVAENGTDLTKLIDIDCKTNSERCVKTNFRINENDEHFYKTLRISKKYPNAYMIAAGVVLLEKSIKNYKNIKVEDPDYNSDNLYLQKMRNNFRLRE